jgi:protein-S-isoprenylcysteine O-methyltransferase Ste14
VIVVPTVWIFYVAIVFEILFMISPFALYYYAAYGPSLNVLHRSRWTSWLTDFPLPHFPYTSSPLLNALPDLGGPLITVGMVLFAVGFVLVYGAKVRGRGLVTGGLYRVARHPQYLGLAIIGLGAFLGGRARRSHPHPGPDQSRHGPEAFRAGRRAIGTI